MMLWHWDKFTCKMHLGDCKCEICITAVEELRSKSSCMDLHAQLSGITLHMTGDDRIQANSFINCRSQNMINLL